LKPPYWKEKLCFPLKSFLAPVKNLLQYDVIFLIIL